MYAVAYFRLVTSHILCGFTWGSLGDMTGASDSYWIVPGTMVYEG